MWGNHLLVGSEISWWFPNILPLESGLIGMVPKNPATRARINRNGSHSSGSEISCDTGPRSAPLEVDALALGQRGAALFGPSPHRVKCLAGLVVKAFASGAADLGSIPAFDVDPFLGRVILVT